MGLLKFQAFFLLILVVLLVGCSVQESQTNNVPFAPLSYQEQLDRLPKVAAAVIGGELKIGGDGSGTMHISVEMPPNHHGYLNKGDEGYLIPLEFSFKAMEDTGALVTAVTLPEGERSDKWGATVLRGTGDYGFRVDNANERLTSLGAVSVSLRYQICDEILDTCYPPKNVEIPMRVVKS